MKNTEYKSDIKEKSADVDTGEMQHKKKHHHGWKIVAIVTGSLIGLVILLLVGATLYLTPNRVKRIIEYEGSKYLAADVRIGSFDYTLWRSLPNLRISADSIDIKSRTLDRLSEEELSCLPIGCKRLASINKIKGSINLWKTLRGNISLMDIEIDAPVCNLVTVDDSVNNYSIFPPMKKDMKLPHISLNKISVGAPVKIRWYDHSSEMLCDAAIDEALLKIIEGKRDRYVINLQGDVDFKSEDFSTVRSLPLVVSSDIGVGFSPLTLTVNRCEMNLADVNLNMQTSVIMGEKPAIGKMNLDFSCDDIVGLTDYFIFPEEERLRDMRGNLPLYANLKLESPYELPNNDSKKSSIPTFTLSVHIPNGELDYPVDKHNMMHIRDLALQADLNIYPENKDASVLLVPMLKFNTDGAKVAATGKITDLMSGDPLLDADIDCNADLSKTTGKFLPNKDVSVAGNLNGSTSVTCRLAGLKEKKLKDLNVKSNFDVNSLNVKDKAMKLIAGIQSLSMQLRASVPSLSTSGLGDSRISLVATSKSGKISSMSDTTDISYQNLVFTGNLGARGTMSNPTLVGKVDMSAGEFSANGEGMKVNMKGIATALTASMRHVPWTSTQSYSTAPTSEGDSLISHRVKHTPLYLTVAAPGMMQTVLSLLNLDADLSIGSGTLLADGYPVKNEISNVNLSTDLDTLVVKSLGIETRGASAELSGKVRGLRNFLLSSTPVELDVDMEANFKDVDINQLSGNYYAGVAKLTGKPADYSVVSEGSFTASDSLCVLIPRNLLADVKLRSERAEYMGWQFSPLSTDITLHDGIAKIGALQIGSTFGNVDVDWSYSTEDLNDIFMKLEVDVNDFDFAKFFKVFPMLTSSMPELENLSGKLSADIDGKLLMFPDMFINTPSMTADVNIHTSDIEFKREGKIKRITNLMLLKGDAPLEINDLNIHGSFHDNLLQLDPFMVDCGPYKVGIAGVNNLQGEMYYHLGLLSWPLHMPFGVNLVGHWPHPSIRFGGANIHDGREREISANLDEDVHVNIMRELKHGWLVFIATAAKYDAENNQSYVFYVE